MIDIRLLEEDEIVAVAVILFDASAVSDGEGERVPPPPRRPKPNVEVMVTVDVKVIPDEDGDTDDVAILVGDVVALDDTDNAADIDIIPVNDPDTVGLTEVDCDAVAVDTVLPVPNTSVRVVVGVTEIVDEAVNEFIDVILAVGEFETLEDDESEANGD